MDIMEQHYDDYIAYLYQMSNKVIDRDTAICYYDCTNFYSEIEQADEDYIDKYTGERIQGFRKYGFSKQHMPNPLVQMGLCMDKDGIPMTMCVTRGNQSEKTPYCLRKASSSKRSRKASSSSAQMQDWAPMTYGSSIP